MIAGLHFVLIGLGLLGAALVSIGMYVNDDMLWLFVDYTSIVLFSIIVIIGIIYARTARP